MCGILTRHNTTYTIAQVIFRQIEFISAELNFVAKSNSSPYVAVGQGVVNFR